MSDDLSGFSLYDLFRTEAESQTVLLSEGIVRLESTGGDPAAIEPLMRAAHSLKGAARIVGMSAAERVAHSLEDVFVAAQKGKIRLSAAHVDTLLASVDLLTEVSQLAEADVADWVAANEGRIEGQVVALSGIESARAGGAAPAATAPVEVPSPTVVAEPGEVVEQRGVSEVGDRAEGAVETKVARARRSKRTAPVVAAVPSGPAGAEAPATRTVAAAGATSPAAQAPRAAAVEVDSSAEAADRVVRITADNLNRLMGLAGESLVQARLLRPLIDSLQQIKRSNEQLGDALRALEETVSGSHPVPGDRLQELMLAAKHKAAHTGEVFNERMERLEDHARRGEDLAERLHHQVISSRLRPLADGVRGFPRLVRDVTRQLGKQVRFEVVGEQTGVDRDILEKLEAPLNHLIRNALDHGVELPADRVSAGKEPTASVRLEARHVAGMLQIRLVDDGRGIDVERVRAKVIERGLAPEAMATQMTEAELLEFLFLPGFSTKGEVTSLSGRGVGLDVVQSMVQAVGGSVRVTTVHGSGTTFTLQLPITMSVIRALIARIAGQPYAFPLSRLDSIQSIDPEVVQSIEGRPFFHLDDQTVGLVQASDVLELPSTPGTGGGLPVAVVSDRGNRFGVVVDEFLGERDLDVRPLDPRLGKIQNISSASVLEDGWPVLIIDVEDLVRSIDNQLNGRRFKLDQIIEAAAVESRGAKRVLVVDDSITVRELERQLLESRGYAVDVAVDGMDGWNAVRSARYDLVVSDVDMPRMDGIQFVSMMRRDAKLRSLPVVIVSYKDREEDRLRGLEAGANSYLTKSSFHDKTFLDTVADLIGGAIE